MLTLINPQSLAAPRGYSNGIVLGGARMLFVAGQIGADREGRLVSTDLVAQFAQALDNVLAVVREAGGRPEQIGRLTIYATDAKAYAASARAIGVEYRRRMGAHYPAMSLVQVVRLFEEGALVELEATAVLP